MGTLAVKMVHGTHESWSIAFCVVWGIGHVYDQILDRSRTIQSLARHPRRARGTCGALLQACREALYQAIECLTNAGQVGGTEFGLAIANEYFYRLYRHEDGVVSVEVSAKTARFLDASDEPLEFSAFEDGIERCCGFTPNRLVDREKDEVDAKGSSRFSAHVYTALQQVGTGEFFDKRALPSSWPRKPRKAPTRRSPRGQPAIAAGDMQPLQPEDEVIALGSEWSGEDQSLATRRRLRNARIRIRLVSSALMDRLIKEGFSAEIRTTSKGEDTPSLHR